MARKLYGYPDVGRFGLGHSLLAWARCVVWCRETGAEMIAPEWFRLRIGPWLRGERDKRTYSLLFTNKGKWTGLARTWLLSTSRKVPSTDVVDRLPSDRTRTVVVFTNALADNEKKHFHEVLGHAPVLRDALIRMTRPEYRPAPAKEPFIGVHVRLGDFTKVSDPSAIQPHQNNIRLPLSWYVEKLHQLRSAIGEMPAMVFSDGSDEELSELLAQSLVSRAPRQSAVTDMLSIAQSSVLISSGSGFSLWGAFLGEVPRVCFPGQNVVKAHEDPYMETQSGIGEPLSAHFADGLRSRIQGPVAE